MLFPLLGVLAVFRWWGYMQSLMAKLMSVVKTPESTVIDRFEPIVLSKVHDDR